jgi:hypothetical protein
MGVWFALIPESPAAMRADLRPSAEVTVCLGRTFDESSANQAGVALKALGGSCGAVTR